jgi:hypothetical protein
MTARKNADEGHGGNGEIDVILVAGTSNRKAAQDGIVDSEAESRSQCGDEPMGKTVVRGGNVREEGEEGDVNCLSHASVVRVDHLELRLVKAPCAAPDNWMEASARRQVPHCVACGTPKRTRSTETPQTERQDVLGTASAVEDLLPRAVSGSAARAGTTMDHETSGALKYDSKESIPGIFAPQAIDDECRSSRARNVMRNTCGQNVEICGIVDGEVLSLAVTNHAGYVGYSGAILDLAADARLPLVACCCIGGEIVVWIGPDVLCGSGVLRCLGIGWGHYKHVAWAGWWDLASVVWDSSVLWTLATDGCSLAAFSICRSDAHAPIDLAPCYTLRLSIEDVEQNAGGGETALYVMPAHSKDDSGLVQHVAVVITAGFLHAMRMSIAPDAHGHPMVVHHVTVARVSLDGAPPACISAVDPLDWSLRLGSGFCAVLLGFYRGVVHRFEILKDFVAVTKEEVSPADSAISKLTLDSTPLGVTCTSAVQLVVTIADPNAKCAVGYVLECWSGRASNEVGKAFQVDESTILDGRFRRKWKIRSEIPIDLSWQSAIASFLPGDGNLLLAVMNVGRISILSPLPSSRAAGIYDVEWTSLDRPRLAQASSMKQFHEMGVSDHVPISSVVAQQALPDWICIREGRMIASEAIVANSGCSGIINPGRNLISKADSMHDDTAPPTPYKLHGKISWSSDGSVVCAGTRGGLFVLTAGIADGGAGLDAAHTDRSRGTSHLPRSGTDGSARDEAECSPDDSNQPLPALWNMLDLLRTGPSSVYYHPTILEHAILLGRLSEVEERLTALLIELRDACVSPGFSRPRFAPPDLNDTETNMRANKHNLYGQTPSSDSGDSVRLETNPSANQMHNASKAASSTTAHYERLRGCDLGPLKKLAGMKLSETSKLGPASALISRQPALLMLLPDDGRRVWDEQAAKLTQAPDWNALLQAIDDAEAALSSVSSVVDQIQEADSSIPKLEGIQLCRKGSKEDSLLMDGKGAERQETNKGGTAADAMREVSSYLSSILSNIDQPEIPSSSALPGLGATWGVGRQLQIGNASRILSGVGRSEVLRMIAVAEGVREAHVERVVAELDEAGLIFWLVCRVWAHLLQQVRQDTTRRQRNSAAVNLAVNGYAICFGLHSDGQDVLLQGLPDDREAMEALWVPLWLDSTPQLRAYAERVGRRVFLDTQDPMAAMLYYVLARKLSLLQGLFKKAGQEKVSQFLQRDFGGDEKSRAAARSNGYTLVGKGQHEAAAAFFVLAGAAQHALDLAAINLARPMLALLVARLAPASEEFSAGAATEAALVRRTLEQVVMPHAEMRMDRGAMHAVKWRLDELVPAYSVLWSSAAADVDSRRLAAGGAGRSVAAQGVALGGLLGKFTDEDADEGAQVDAAEYEVEEGVHACTAALLSIVSKRPRMRLAMRMHEPQPVPWQQMELKAAMDLLRCGCGSLIISSDLLGGPGRAGRPGGGATWKRPPGDLLGTSSDLLGGRWGSLEADAAAQACQVEHGQIHDQWADSWREWHGVAALPACLGWLADWIRGLSAEAWRRSPGEICPQAHLETLHQEVQQLAGIYRVREAAVVPLLCRFCHVRGLWRMEHALVTGHYGRAGRDASLAEVAAHPLTLSVVESVARFPQLLPVGRSVLSRMERTGKVLQLVLHSLTVDKSGNTGALATLAASVMAVHFVLVWARDDAAGLRRLLLRNEGAEDQDSAMALAWLMDACDPGHFQVGGSGPARRPGSGRESAWEGRGSGAGWESGAWAAETDACGSHDEGLGSGCADRRGGRAAGVCAVRVKCLRWLAACRFHARLAMALSEPPPEPAPIPRACTRPDHAPTSPSSSASKSSACRVLLPPPPPDSAPVSFSAPAQHPGVPAHGRAPLSADPRGPPDDGGPPASPGLRLFSQVKKWAGKRSGSLDRIQDHLKHAALRALHASPLHASHSTPSLKASASVSARSLDDPEASAPAAGPQRPRSAQSWHDAKALPDLAGGGDAREARRRTACGLERLLEQAGTAGPPGLSPGLYGDSPNEGGGPAPPWLQSESLYSQSLTQHSISRAFFASESSDALHGPDTAWQQAAAERLGNALLRAMLAWARGLRREVEAAVAAAVCATGQRGAVGLAAAAGGGGDDGPDGQAGDGPDGDGPEWTGLWRHFQGQEHLDRVIWRALSEDGGGRAEMDAGDVTLGGVWALLERRNAVLDELRYPGRYSGRLQVSILGTECIRPPPSGLLMLGHAVKTASLLSMQPVAAWAGAGAASLRQAGMDHVAMQAGSRPGEFRPTTQVCFRLECAGPEESACGWQSARHKSAWVRNSAAPRFDVQRSVSLPAQRWARQELRVELLEKHNFGEDVIGAASLDVAAVPCSGRPQLASVWMTRPEGGEGDDGVVCLLQLEVRAWYQLDPDTAGDSGAGVTSGGGPADGSAAGLAWY